MSSFGIAKRGVSKKPGKKTANDCYDFSVRDLHIVDYTEKCFVVMGDTLSHSNVLIQLGGKYNHSLRCGPGWIFTIPRRESVEKFIDTGIVEPYVYPDKNNYVAGSGNTNYSTSTQGTTGNFELRKIFREFREAFDPNSEYDGVSIIDVIRQLEEKYVPSKQDKIVATAKKVGRSSLSNGPSDKNGPYEKPQQQQKKRLARRVPAEPIEEPESDPEYSPSAASSGHDSGHDSAGSDGPAVDYNSSDEEAEVSE